MWIRMNAIVVVAAALALAGCHHSGGSEPAAKAAAEPAAAKEAAPSAGEAQVAGTRTALLGHPAPTATLELLDGTTVALADLIGRKPIYLKFWATWCKPCRAQMPHLDAAYQRYGDRIAIYAIAFGLNDPIEGVRAFATEQQLHVPVGFDRDGSVAAAYQVTVTPMHILIDRAGVIRYVGHEASPELDAALAALANPASSGATTAASAPPTPPTAPTTASSTALPPLVTSAGAPPTLPVDKPVVVSFVTTWCDTYLADSRPAMATACAAHTREIARLQHERPNLAWILVAHPDWTAASELGEFVDRFTLRPVIGLDPTGAWFARYAVRAVPTTIVLSSTGAELARITGPGDTLSRALDRAVPR
jgi:thiol-disulfide isomerase/thioredoxin